MAPPHIYGTIDNYTKWYPQLHRVITCWLGKKHLKQADYYQFAKFIGHPCKNSKYKYIVDFENPEVQDIIRTLDGPHCKALLKVIEIRNAEKDKS